MDSVNSTTFIKRPPYMSDVQERFLYTKELLSGRIFLGNFIEKRYVTPLNEYRDVVSLNSEETDLQQDIDKIRRKWLGVKDLKWVGVTGPDEFGFPNAYCFCVKLRNLALGQYWFQIKHVKLVEQEIVYQLKCIRKSQTPLCSLTPQGSELITDLKSKISAPSTSSASKSVEMTSILEPQKTLSLIQESCVNTIQTIRPVLVVKNFISVVKVGCALAITLVMAAFSLVGHLGEYALKLIREFTLLVNAFTPIVIQLIDFLTKIVGGFFILIATMLRHDNHPPIVQPYRNQILYGTLSNNQGAATSQNAIDWRERNRLLRQELLSNTHKRK